MAEIMLLAKRRCRRYEL